MQKRIKKQYWLSPEDNAELRRKVQLAGIPESSVIRILIRGYEPREKPDDRFYNVMRELNAIGNNINQLEELHPFKDHPFKVQNNEEMGRMVESIKKVGAITPCLARPLPDGGYELISGHRRLAACQMLGLETMPVIVREMSDDEAVIAMVDANLQREQILPSEKAFAYKMKRDALNHQGVTSPQLGEKLLTIEKVGLDGGDSKNQVLRYIRLTHLIPELLSMVDDGKMAFSPAVEISFLEPSEQRVLLNAMEMNDCTPSHAQAIKLKKYSQEGVLNDQTIYKLWRRKSRTSRSKSNLSKTS